MEHARCLVLWIDDIRVYLEVKDIKMQLPKAIKVATHADAALVVDVYNRVLLFAIGEGDAVRYVRMHPSGKEEDLTDKVKKAYDLVSGSAPLKQGGIFDGVSEKDGRTRKSS